MIHIPNASKDVVLHPLTDISILDLIFLPVNDGYFRKDSTASDAERGKYRKFLLDNSETRLQCGIYYKGTQVGFILVAGPNTPVVPLFLVGGILPEYQRKGIYRMARNSVIRYLNKNGIYDVVSSYDPKNKVMKSFMDDQYTTKLYEDLRITHPDSRGGFATVNTKVAFGKDLVSCERPMYHLSFNDNLPDVLKPREPEGTGAGTSESDFPETDMSRVSMAPSPELCFRAIYPNISHLLEDKKVKDITLTLYRAVDLDRSDVIAPFELITKRMVHDAHITLEHISTKPVKFERVGKVTFKNTSMDKGLYYKPYLEYEFRYHSPKDIIVTKQE